MIDGSLLYGRLWTWWRLTSLVLRMGKIRASSAPFNMWTCSLQHNTTQNSLTRHAEPPGHYSTPQTVSIHDQLWCISLLISLYIVLGNKDILLIDLFLFGYLPINLAIVINTDPKWSRVQWKVMMELHQCFGVLLSLRRVGTLYWWRQACVYPRSQQTSTAKQAEDGVWVDH